MRIATWNVNSVRSRIDRVEAFLERNDIDVLALQETKAVPDQIPTMNLEIAGYEVAAVGYDQWNGVALVSRVGIEDIKVGFPGMPEFNGKAEARALGAVCGGVGIWSLYVPNGRKPDDPHYAYKLEWLAALKAASSEWHGTPTALVGDWNVCPFDEDCFDPSQFKNSTHLTQPERDAFFAIEADYRDVVRPHVPGPEKYTYFDYYRQRFERNRGLRIDFVLGSPTFAERVTGAFVDLEERDPAKFAGAPSDHAPVVVDLAD
ncbi:exodeoxyribonuclease III [Nocardioides baekrokdamisoli]|uniref:Exodeoxyribonuclease III n=1 Tax=Nocardioides baekrokdamisoli TaxID=1804624 RepID=A0A3G9IEU6_9ACTN|nr:exodeoxyribonuclease III [Nocardioides baekrokdamisoli]BBH16812.1 exodeoxyribonuclease III [Nocardioides baekrokdamisoli]